MKKITAAAAALAATFVLVVAGAPAHANRDTNWPCAGCITTHR